MKTKLQNIKELCDIEQITIETLQALIDLLNSDHIKAQEELKAKMKKITCNFNIKKYCMEKDVQSKQCHIELLEARNIALNQIQNQKDDETCQQSKIIESIKE